MLRSIINASLRFRLLVVAIAAGVIGVGIMQLNDAPKDVLPEFTPPYAEVQTEALGLSAEEVEQLITVPLEADLLNGVQGVDVIRSESVPSMSSITMVFEPGTDIYRGRQLIEERLTQAHALPNVSAPPTLLQPLSSSSRVMMIGMSSKDISPIEKSVIARWTVQPRLMGVPGVANVSVWGMRDQQLQVQVDPERLRDQDVTLSQVISTAGNAQVVSPLSFLESSTPGSGGFIETPQQRLQVRNVLEKIADPKELGKIPVEDTGGKLRLSDVSDIKVDHQPLIGDAVVNDADGLLLVVEKFPGANTAEVTAGVEGALDKLSPGLRGVEVDTSVFRPATFIEDAVDNIALTVTIAAVLAAFMLAAFLFHWRTVLVALATIPVSLVAAAVVLDLMGESLNAISFAGLAIGLAVVIGDAVAGAENVSRRLREHRESGADTSVASVVVEASHEVRSPLAYGTLIALLAIVPVVVMEGRPGAFFEPLALAYALAVLAAMVVALTLTPALSLLLASRGRPGGASPLVGRMRPRYDGALQSFMKRPRTALIAAGACLLVGLAVLPLLGTSPIPTFKDRDVLVRLDGDPGTSNPRMTQIATSVSRDLRTIPGVDNVGAHVGRAVTGDQVVDVNSSEVWVSVDSDADYDATMASIRDVVDRTKGVDSEVVTASSQTISDVGALNEGDNPNSGNGLNVLTGSDKPVVVRVYGQNLDTLRAEATKVRDMVAKVDGVVDPRIEAPPTQPTLQIEVDLDKARALGIKPGDVRRAEGTLLHGIQVGSVFQDQKVFQVVVQGVPSTRASVAAVRNLLIDRPEGGHVRMSEVADVRVAPTAAVIQREAVSRHVDIEAGLDGRSADDVAGDIEDGLAATKFPLEYHAEVLTDSTGDEIGGMTIAAFALGCALAILLLLQAAFRSWRLAALAFASLPVALTGGAVAALIDGADITLGAGAAFLALFAIAARSGVLLIRHLQELEHREGMAFGLDLVRRGAGERMTMILAGNAALGIVALTVVVMGERPGLEVLHPMAVVLLGGLITSTFVSLFVLPALYTRVATASDAAAEADEDLLYRWAGVAPGTQPAPVTTGDRAGVARPAAPPPAAPDKAGAEKSGVE
jgi:CzcA family heavy metal efflux pump